MRMTSGVEGGLCVVDNPMKKMIRKIKICSYFPAVVVVGGLFAVVTDLPHRVGAFFEF